jgi:hypothetical protein
VVRHLERWERPGATPAVAGSGRWTYRAGIQRAVRALEAERSLHAQDGARAGRDRHLLSRRLSPAALGPRRVKASLGLNSDMSPFAFVGRPRLPVVASRHKRQGFDCASRFAAFCSSARVSASSSAG